MDYSLYITLRNNEEELKQYAHSRAHLEAMKASKRITQKIRTITTNTDCLPKWKDAKDLLKEGIVIKY